MSSGADTTVTGRPVHLASDYFRRFKGFTKYYPRREQILAAAVVSTGGTWRPGSLRILDVGSSDGMLLTQVIQAMPASVSQVEVICLEPDEVAVDAFVERRHRLPEEVEIRAESVEEYVAGPASHRDTFDLILCSHVFYHISDAVDITKSLASRLAPGGRLVSILDSHDSPIYWARRDLGIGAQNMFEAHPFGNRLGGEGLEEALTEAGISHRSATLAGHLAFGDPGAYLDAVGFLARTDLSPDSEACLAMLKVFEAHVDLRHGGVAMVPWRETVTVIGADPEMGG